MSLEDRLATLLGEVLPSGVQVEVELVAESAEETGEVVADVGPGPRADHALTERALGVGDDQVGVDLHAGADAVARGAGPERRVERERARLEVVGLDVVVVGARHPLGELHLLVGVLAVEVDEVEDDEARGEVERGLDGVGQAALGRRLGREPVHDHLDGVLLLLLELGRVGELDRLPVDPGPAEPLRLQGAEELDELPLAAPDHWREHLEAGALVELEHPVDDLLRSLPLDRGATDRAVRPPGAGVEQAQVVVDLGDRADGRARVLRRGLLVDRHRGAQALDEVDIGLVHLAQELAGVRRERLDVATLALCEDRVEGEAGLARAGKAGEHDQGISGQVERDVLEIVLARAPNDELISHE